MNIPSYLRLTLFCAHAHSVATREGRAWSVGTKEPIDLDMENVQELVDLGILEIKDRPQTGGADGMIGAFLAVSVDRFSSAPPLTVAFNATFADGVLPSHPGLWETGDESEATFHNYLKNGGLPEIIPVIYSRYGEKLFVTRSHEVATYPEKYVVGQRGVDSNMDASMLATLRCVIEHDVYSSGHLWVARKDGGKPYDRVMDSQGLYAMIRFGMIEAVEIEGRAEHYVATTVGRRAYELALPHLKEMQRLDRWAEVATGMDW